STSGGSASYARRGAPAALPCVSFTTTSRVSRSFFFFTDTATTEIYTLSLHDALPISSPSAGSSPAGAPHCGRPGSVRRTRPASRSEEHTSELQSRFDLVCRLLLEKKKKAHEHTCHYLRDLLGDVERENAWRHAHPAVY